MPPPNKDIPKIPKISSWDRPFQSRGQLVNGLLPVMIFLLFCHPQGPALWKYLCDQARLWALDKLLIMLVYNPCFSFLLGWFVVSWVSFGWSICWGALRVGFLEFSWNFVICFKRRLPCRWGMSSTVKSEISISTLVTQLVALDQIQHRRTPPRARTRSSPPPSSVARLSRLCACRDKVTTPFCDTICSATKGPKLDTACL
jgi:hypothetical protein